MLNLKALLIKILAQITPINKSVTTTGSYQFHFRRVGDIVFIESIAPVTTLANQYNGWFTADVAFRPTGTRYVPCLLGGDASTFAMIRIESSGAVAVYSHYAVSNQNVWLSGCYRI